MKKSIIAIAAVSVLTLGGAYLYARGGDFGGCPGYGPGWSQGSGFMHGPGRGYGRGFGRLYFMKDYLGLSEEQVDKIAKIDSDYSYQYFINRNNPDKVNALRTEHKKAAEGVLTSAQKRKWDEFLKDRDRERYGYNRHWAK